MGPLLSRRRWLQSAAALAATKVIGRRSLGAAASPFGAYGQPLTQVAYSQVTVTSAPHRAQIENTQAVLAGISDNSLLMPFRAMARQPAPGENIGGWYEYKADYDPNKDDAGLAPSATFGQWVSSIARTYAADGDPHKRERVLRLHRLYAETITPMYYRQNRFPAYCFDKLVCGLMDAHALAQDPDAFAILAKTTDTAAPLLPGNAVDRDVAWLKGRDNSWNWDESYTLPENLYLVSAMGAGARYRAMAEQYLLESYFGPLAAGKDVLGGRHAYSYINALCSAMQAYMVGGSEEHLCAAKNGFDFLEQQAYATGGYGPDEKLVTAGTDGLYDSLTTSHNSFETPCGAYAKMKLTRYLLRVTRDGRYGDAMERVMVNTVLGAKPMQPDGHAFYYADYNVAGKRVYSEHRWPCCSGTLPQVAADYGINSYFQDPGAVWVNLYIPSVFRWQQGATRLTLTQDHSYPDTGAIRLRVTASADTNFALELRVPAWAPQPSVLLRVNGQPLPVRIEAGFTSISRTWKSGDTVELTLPMLLRLEPLPSSPANDHSRTVALRRGPVVLFPLNPGTLKVAERDALAARQTGAREWTISTPSGPVKFVPFTQVGEATYSTYFKLG